MAPALTIKSYDTYPPVAITLTDSNGAINLTTATGVKFVAKGTQSMTVITGACTITNATTGQVSYSWGATDTQTPDNYPVEIEITWTGGGKQKVPNAAASNPVIEIDADLNGNLGIALCVDCNERAEWRPGEGEVGTEQRVPGVWECPNHGEECQVHWSPDPDWVDPETLAEEAA